MLLRSMGRWLTMYFLGSAGAVLFCGVAVVLCPRAQAASDEIPPGAIRTVPGSREPALRRVDSARSAALPRGGEVAAGEGTFGGRLSRRLGTARRAEEDKAAAGSLDTAPRVNLAEGPESKTARGRRDAAGRNPATSPLSGPGTAGAGDASARKSTPGGPDAKEPNRRLFGGLRGRTDDAARRADAAAAGDRGTAASSRLGRTGLGKGADGQKLDFPNPDLPRPSLSTTPGSTAQPVQRPALPEPGGLLPLDAPGRLPEPSGTPKRLPEPDAKPLGEPRLLGPSLELRPSPPAQPRPTAPGDLPEPVMELRVPR